MKKLIHELLELTNPAVETKVDDILSRYHDLRKLKDSYASLVDEEALSGEIAKLKIFNESKLKINLPKFNNYGSKLDIYLSKWIFENPSKNNTKKNDGRCFEK